MFEGESVNTVSFLFAGGRAITGSSINPSCKIGKKGRYIDHT